MAKANGRYVVRCVWSTASSVPGGYIESRHDTRAEAEAEKARLDTLEAVRRAKPQMSKAEARRVAVEHYGEPGGNKYMAGVIAGAVRKLTARRTTEYVVEVVPS